MTQPSKSTAELGALLAEVRAANDRYLRRQYLGNDADHALRRLRDAYASDQISIETLEEVTEDIVFGRPARMPAAGCPRPRRDRVSIYAKREASF